MIVIAFGVFVSVLVGILVCVKHDAPQYYGFVRRIVVGVLLAIVLGSALLYAAELPVFGCNDFEKYSFYWYYNLCFIGEHSS